MRTSLFFATFVALVVVVLVVVVLVVVGSGGASASASAAAAAEPLIVNRAGKVPQPHPLALCIHCCKRKPFGRSSVTILNP